MSTGRAYAGSSGEDLAFVRRRIGLVSGVVAAIAGVAALGGLLQGLVGPLADQLPVNASSYYAFGSAAAFAGVAAACVLLPLGRRTIAAVEVVGYTVGCLLVVAGAFEIGLELRPEMMALTAFTYLLVLRAALVPTTAPQTLWLCLGIGVPLVCITWLKYSANADFLAAAPAVRQPGITTFWTAVWWSFTTAVCTVISSVVHGLRREVRAAQRLGQYTLDDKLGGGGMGEVWRATHRLLRRPAAIKLIRPGALGAAGQGVQARFEREAQTTASLQSPHTVELYDFGVTDEGVFYHVMELLVGWDLEALVREHGPLPAERVVFLLDQICDSLDDAHTAGLVHRDIKPANIMVTRRGRHGDFVKVLDFGLAKAVVPGRGDAGLTREGTVPGTPAYMPPEALTGRHPVDARSDVYAVGCVAYWLLTGTAVFEGRTPMAVAAAHLSETPAPPSSRTELPIPEPLDRLVLDCLAKEPGDRPASALALSARLQDCGISTPWTEARARDWWSLHRPSAPSPAPRDPSLETHRVVHPARRM